jgi:hypothetical protein
MTDRSAALAAVRLARFQLGIAYIGRVRIEWHSDTSRFSISSPKRPGAQSTASNRTATDIVLELCALANT